MRLIQKILVFIILLGTVTATNVFAGGNAGQVGIGFTVAESSPVFIFHYWASEKLTISPEISVNHLSDPSIIRTNFGLTLASHSRPAESFRPFFGVGFNYDVATSDGNSVADLYIGPLFGAEYFFSDNFSVSGAYQVAVIITDDVASPSIMLRAGTTYITTAQLLTVQYYF